MCSAPGGRTRKGRCHPPRRRDCVLALGAVVVFYKEYAISEVSTRGFAHSPGHACAGLSFTALCCSWRFAIVSSLQGRRRGACLGNACHPSSSRVPLDRPAPGRCSSFHRSFGMVSGGASAFFLSSDAICPRVPSWVLAAGAVFAAALFFGPRHGIFSALVAAALPVGPNFPREHAQEAIYRVLEDQDFETEQVSARELAERDRHETLEEASINSAHFAAINMSPCQAMATPHPHANRDPHGRVDSWIGRHAVRGRSASWTTPRDWLRKGGKSPEIPYEQSHSVFRLVSR